MDDEQIYAVGDGPVIISIGIPLGSPLCEEDKEESKALRSFNSPPYRRTFSGVAHDVFCSSWVRFIFVILDLVLSLAIIYRTILFQNTPGLDTEQQHELTSIGIKQIASLQAEMVVKMILWNRFQDKKPREGNKRSFALCYWYGYMLLSFSIQLLVFLEVLKQISWLTM